MADSFLDGDVTLDTFIDVYRSKRKLAHHRRVKIDKLREMVLKGQQLPQAPPSTFRSQDVSAARPAPVLPEASDGSPVPQPRRRPPPPPSQPVPTPALAPAPAPALAPAPQPSVFYAASPYPPIPPRSGQHYSSVNSGYPHVFMSQYPPALPQRPPPRMAPQPGFIMQ